MKLTMFVFIFVFLSPCVLLANEWYVGNNLNEKKLSEWVTSERDDRLATCSDFVETTKTGKRVKKNMGKDGFRSLVGGLCKCVYKASKDKSQQEMLVIDILKRCAEQRDLK